MQHQMPPLLVFAVNVGGYERRGHLITILIENQLFVNDVYSDLVGFKPMFMKDLDVYLHVG